MKSFLIQYSNYVTGKINQIITISAKDHADAYNVFRERFPNTNEVTVHYIIEVQMSDLERHVRENWSQMSVSDRLFAMMDLGEEQGVEPVTVDEWMALMPQPRSKDEEKI